MFADEQGVLHCIPTGDVSIDLGFVEYSQFVKASPECPRLPCAATDGHLQRLFTES